MDQSQKKEFVKQVCNANGHSDKIWAVSWHPSGNIFATCSSDKTVKIWQFLIEGDESSPKYSIQLKQTLSDSHDRTIRSVAFSPDGKMLASGSFDSTIVVYALKESSNTYEQVAKLEGHENEVKCVCWDSSGKYLASCSRDKSVWVWDYEDGFEFSCYAVIDAHTQDVKHVQFIPNTFNLASCSFDDKMKIWQQEDDDWTLKETYSNHTSIVWCVTFSQDGQFMATCSDDKVIKVYKKNINDAFSTPYMIDTSISNAHARSILSLSFSEGGTFLASGGADNSINVYQRNMEACNFEGQDNSSFVLLENKPGCHFGDINCVAFHPTKDILISVSDDRKIKVWTVEIDL